MAEKQAVLRPTDDEARALARRLVREARYAALAVLEPGTGVPLASRVAVATDIDGAPLILVSTLSVHTDGLANNPVCSLLLGEPGKGDPLAHPRLTLIGRAERLEKGSFGEDRARRRYLARQPKARLYADFTDFALHRIEPERANLNGGFGKAYELQHQDLVVAAGRLEHFADMEAEAVSHMNEDHREAVSLYARVFGNAAEGDWCISGIDPDGMDLLAGDEALRIDFDPPLAKAEDLRDRLVEMAAAARVQIGHPPPGFA